MLNHSDKTALWAMVNGWITGAAVLTTLYIRHFHALPTLAAMVLTALAAAVVTVNVMGSRADAQLERDLDL